MAHTKTAVKRLQTSKKSNIRNRMRNSEIKTVEKSFRSAVAAGDKDLAASLIKKACSKLDKAAKAGTVHKNKVANKKSQLDKLMNSVNQ